MFEPLVNTSDDALHLQLYNDAYALMAADDSAAVASLRTCLMPTRMTHSLLFTLDASPEAMGDGREGESGSRIVMREK